MNNQSEMTCLLQQIETETIAMQQALSGYASVAPHSIITQRYQTINKAGFQLQNLVGKDYALALVFEVYRTAMNYSKPFA